MRRTINFLINLGEDIEEKRYSVGFLLDLSGSMQGAPIEHVKIAINNLLKPLINTKNALDYTDQVSIVTFHSNVHKVCPWVGRSDFDFFKEFLFGIPGMADAFMSGTGATALFDGMAEIINSCISEAESENERIILIFSDGCSFGDKKYSKKSIEKLLLKNRYGYILKSEAINVNSNYSAEVFDRILKDVPGEDYYVFTEGLTENTIAGLISESEIQSSLINALKSTKKPVRICTLYYRDEGASSKGRVLLQKFADLTDGIVFDAPSPDSIPKVMQELFHELRYSKQSGIRAGLINRLEENTIEGNSNWFRVFSINADNLGTRKNLVSNPIDHTIFNLPVTECKSRNQVFNAFKKHYDDEHVGISQVLINNLYQQNQELPAVVQTNPIVYITIKGNDLSGTAIPLELLKILGRIRSNPNDILGTKDTDYHVFILILIDQTVAYTEDEKRNLAAFLNEVNIYDPDIRKINGIFLIGERNDHFSSNPKGYKTLSAKDFEQLVTENLSNLNLNQQVAISSYLLGLDARKENRSKFNRFLSLGSVTLFASAEEYINKIVAESCHRLLNNIYHDSFLTDPDSVKQEVGIFLGDISFSSFKGKILNYDNKMNLLSRFDCPSALTGDFTESWNEIHLKFIDHTNPELHFRTSKINNHSFIEYVQFLCFDVRNYVESCNSPSTFNTEILSRIEAHRINKEDQLKATTDSFLYRGHLSSPKQAELWIMQLFKSLNSYIGSTFDYDVSVDVDVIEYSTFSYKTQGLDINDDNTEVPLDELKKKLENYPLPISSRFKFYSLAVLFAAGFLNFINSGILLIVSALGLIVPLLIVTWGEYRINQNKKQLRKLINWYAQAHQHRSRRQALSFIRDHIHNILVNIKNKIRQEDDGKSLDYVDSVDLTEANYLDLFRNALTVSFPKYFEYESTHLASDSRFHIDLIKGYYGYNDSFVEIIDDVNIERILNINRGNYNQHLAILLEQKETIQKSNFPIVKLNFIPHNFNDQLNEISMKPKINLVDKLDFKEIVPEKYYTLTLLDILTTDEITELKNMFNNKIWHQKIDTINKLFSDITTISDENFFSLWREVGFYQAWLNKIAQQVMNDGNDSNKLNSDSIFNLWKKVYQARKDFREKLVENYSKIFSFNVEQAINYWQFIFDSSNKEELLDHIKSWSFAPIYLTNADNSYTIFSRKNYVSSERYLSGKLQRLYNKGLQGILQDKQMWEETKSLIGNSLDFSHSVAIPVQDNSLLSSMSVIFNSSSFVENKHGELEKYFLAHIAEKYLKTKKQRREFKWILH
jgi:hypothetical protein